MKYLKIANKVHKVTNKIQYFFLFSLLILSSCGPNKFGKSGQELTVNEKLLTTCSHDVLNLSDISIRVMATSNLNYVRVKFDRFPLDFTRRELSLKVSTLTFDSAGNQIPPRAVSFLLERYNQNSSFSPLRTLTQFQSLNSSQINTVIQSDQIVAGTAAEFFSSVTLNVNLQDPNHQTQVLVVTLYEGNTVAYEVESLIPTFYANPNVYAETHSNALIQKHPLNYLSGGKWSDLQYQSEASRYCF